MHLLRLHSSFYYHLFIKNSVLVAQQATNRVSKVSLTNKAPTDHTGCPGNAQTHNVTAALTHLNSPVQPRDKAPAGG